MNAMAKTITCPDCDGKGTHCDDPSCHQKCVVCNGECTVETQD
jgi:DnaJ-class molecular chaperone